MTGHSTSAIVTQICLLGAAPSIRVIHTHEGAATLRNLFAAVVADEDGLSCHYILLLLRFR
jgi:hypothetical protein